MQLAAAVSAEAHTPRYIAAECSAAPRANRVSYAAVRALLRALSNVLRVLLLPLWLPARVLQRPSHPWLVLRLSPRLCELPVPVPLWRRLLPQGQAAQPSSLQELRAAAEIACADPRVAGWLVHLPHLHAGWALCEGLREVFATLRAAGKQVVCYLPEGGGSRELYVALAADRILLAPPASIAPLGIASQSVYLKHLLERVGVTVQVQATGDYKSAAEPLLRDGMSAAAREQTEALLGTLHEALRKALASRTGMDDARIDAVLAKGLMTADQARDLGLADALAYEDELLPSLGIADAKRSPWTVGHYLHVRRAKLLQPVFARPYVAVVSVRGTIMGDEPGLTRTGATLSAVVSALRAAAADRHAAAVILLVSSPGGSAHASDLIHREVQLLAKRKPVVACLSDVAASGGYYIAAAATRIVAQPVTITGSIGVISLKVAIDGLLERLGIRTDALRTAEHAGMFSIMRRLSGDQEKMMQQHAEALYARFLAVVAEGRGKPLAEIDAMARGRVWSGRDAHVRGLVDVLGGFRTALDEARKLVTVLPPAQRDTLQPRAVVYRGKQPLAPMSGKPDPAQALEALLPGEIAELAGLLRREPLLYYAPSTEPS